MVQKCQIKQNNFKKKNVLVGNNKNTKGNFIKMLYI